MASGVASWVNLDFEAELMAAQSYRPAAATTALCQKWSHILRLLPQGRDSSCLTSTLEPPQQSFEQLLVWGVTPRATRLGQQLGAVPFPGDDLVRNVNDKRYSHNLEGQLGLQLPHSQIIHSDQQFQQAAQNCPFDWVIKHPFGYSGRERIFGKAHHLSSSAQGWASKRLQEGWTLLFEPWVERVHDFSLHFEVAPTKQVRYLGWCSLVSDRSGGYRGNFVAPERPVEPQALEIGERVAAELAQSGYWGPVGIDAFSGRLGDQQLLRPLVEINARCSFGRLTLALGDWLPGGWAYLWWHPSQAEVGLLPDRLPPLPELGSVRVEAGLYQLPLQADPNQASNTVILAAASLDEVRRLLPEQWPASLRENFQLAP